jgi:hypothetical protein
MRHILSNVDTTDRTAICSVCGEVPVVRNSKTWRCQNKSMQLNKLKTLRKSNIDPQSYKDFIALNPPSINEKCAICGASHSENRKGLALDHCHNTGKIRGYLCQACNLGLGNFKDDKSLLLRAIEYLK